MRKHEPLTVLALSTYVAVVRREALSLMRYMFLVSILILWSLYIRASLWCLNLDNDFAFYGGILFMVASFLGFPRLLIFVWRNTR